MMGVMSCQHFVTILSLAGDCFYLIMSFKAKINILISATGNISAKPESALISMKYAMELIIVEMLVTLSSINRII